MASGFYVDNLPTDVTEERLKEVFTQIGEVKAVRFGTDEPAKKCFVEMSLDVDAYRAVKCFNGATIRNRKILLREA